MRSVLALFVVIFIAAAIGVWSVMAMELRVIASILPVGFGIVTAGIGGAPRRADPAASIGMINSGTVETC